LDQLLAGGSLKPEDLAGEDGLFRRLKKALLERALGAELELAPVVWTAPRWI
jgi:transposase-like protein